MCISLDPLASVTFVFIFVAVLLFFACSVQCLLEPVVVTQQQQPNKNQWSCVLVPQCELDFLVALSRVRLSAFL